MHILKLLAASAMQSVENEISLQYVANAQLSPNSNTHTYNNVNIGAANATRLVVVGVGANSGNNRRISGVTIGGVAATLVNKVDGANTIAGLYVAAVPLGALANVVISFSGSMSRSVINVWSLYDAQSATPEDAELREGNSSTHNITLLGTTGGAVIAFSVIQRIGQDASWSAVIEDSEIQSSSGFIDTSAASLIADDASVRLSIVWTTSGTLITLAARWI